MHTHTDPRRKTWRKLYMHCVDGKYSAAKRPGSTTRSERYVATSSARSRQKSLTSGCKDDTRHIMDIRFKPIDLLLCI